MNDIKPPQDSNAPRADEAGSAVETIVFNATLLGSPDSFPAPADLPLLVAAEHAGLAPPSSCRNGTCRSCIAQLVSGRVSYRIAWPGLSAEEKADGFILPCVAYPVGDVVLRLGSVF